MFNKNSFHQEARNFAEEMYLFALSEGYLAYGCYVQSSCYAKQANMDGLFYSNVFLKKYNKRTDYECWKDTLLKLQMMFRDISLFEGQKILFDILKQYTKFLTDREQLQMNLSFFYSSFKQKNHDFGLNSFLSYLNANRELIFSDLENIMVWYVLIFQVLEQDDDEILALYERTMVSLIPEEKREIINELLVRKSDPSIFLNRILNRLCNSMYHDDMTSEIKYYKSSFNRLIEKAVLEKDAKCFINAFLVLYDLSLIRKELPAIPWCVYSPESLDSTFNFYNYIPERFIQILPSCTDYYCFVNIGNKLIYLPIINNVPTTPEYFQNWNLSEITNFLLEFDEGVKSNSSNPEQGQRDTMMNLQDTSLSFFSLNLLQERPIGIISNPECSSIPFNLLQDDKGFIFLRQPIHNFIIRDFFNSESIELINDFSCKLWVPADTGDSPINIVFSKLEKTIEKYSVNYATSTTIPDTSTENIKIIIAHGSSSIDTLSVLTARGGFGDERKYIYEDIETYLKNTPIAILFVCHAGKISSDFFHSRMNSLISKLFRNNIQVIIAPKWALSTDVPPVWLPIFLREVSRGNNGLCAFHAASLEVHRQYPHCSMWANLHYFGNPSVAFSSASIS